MIFGSFLSVSTIFSDSSIFFPILPKSTLFPSFFIEDVLLARALSIAIVCLILWLSEIVPAFVPTLLLWTITPILLGGLNRNFALSNVLRWSADPVMPLFFGGFALSVAATKYGLDKTLAELAVKISGGRRVRLIFLTAFVTAFLSMWMSNIAAAAMMIVAVHPLLSKFDADDSFRRAMLLAIAFGADFGGIASPIGSGPNAIAVSAVSHIQNITFVQWMGFGLPLTILLIIAALGLVFWKLNVKGPPVALSEITGNMKPGAKIVIGIALATITLWITEPLHGIPAAVVALGGTSLLFISGMLIGKDLAKIDWSTLLLIAGGLGMGRLLEQSGILATAASAIQWHQISHFVMLLGLCLASAFLSALMSNTATATILIPLAATISSEPSTIIIVAIAASLGIPFVISTPPNAMVYGEGGIESKDFMIPGLLIMIIGCVVISLTGPFILGLLGID